MTRNVLRWQGPEAHVVSIPSTAKAKWMGFEAYQISSLVNTVNQYCVAQKSPHKVAIM